MAAPIRRRWLWLGAVGALGLVALARCLFAPPRYAGAKSDHFDGRRFHNQVPVVYGRFDFLRWMLTREEGPWREWVDAEPGLPPPVRVDGNRLRVTFINHATLLVQMDGLNILTDPIWSERCSPVSWAGPRRHRPPGIHFRDLPPIDVVLLSHNHYDHLDLPTLKRLAAEHAPRIYVPLGNRRLLNDQGIEGVIEMGWWEEEALPPLRITAVPVQHFSARGVTDRNASLWSGWYLRSPAGGVFFAGDTGWGPHFEQVRERLGAPRVALLPIGAFRPRWFMAQVHISPDEMLRAHRTLGARISIPMHYGTFHLGDDGEREPIERLRVEMAEADEENIWILGFGEGREIPR
ncbi:MAG TPA: MBL fold metallo-hydrolase [Thermoanaerobaculia bacterium]|nr:MBL fold metallo-hydrolase [Thermoanaerobaculia bacterium]